MMTLFCTIFFFFFSISSAIDAVTPSHPLSSGETLISANGTFAVGFFTPPNTYIGIWYPVPNLNATLSITAGDATLHLISSDNSTLWRSIDHPTDMKIGPNLKTGPSNPSPGKYTAAIHKQDLYNSRIASHDNGAGRDRQDLYYSRIASHDKDVGHDDQDLYYFGIASHDKGEYMFFMKESPDEVAGHDRQDIYYYKIASQDKGRSKRKQWVLIVASIAFVFILIILMCAFMIRRRKHKNKEQSISSESWDREIMHKIGNSEITLFKFTQVANATNNFSDTNKLGKGGFGFVYKGKLPDGQDVAIKRLSTRSRQGLEEFKNEISLIPKLQHRNLVRLLGCCIYGKEKMLIYEFMPNKSLDFLLFDVEEGLKLHWARRSQIIEGIAQGLLYLHKHSRLRIIHRDLKASNILLDIDMNPKISDFGMARIFDSNDIQVNTRRIVGTFGYMSPEYALNGQFSIKSDVFSFGVLVLEIVSGKKNTHFQDCDSWCNLLTHAWNLWKEANWMELVDPALGDKFRYDEAARCIYVALLCVQESPDDRPIMSDVITMLSNESLSINTIKQPAFFMMKNASNSKCPLNLLINASSNDLSISTIAGR